MKKIIRLTESDLTKIVKRVIKENESMINNILDKMNSVGYENLNSDEKSTLDQYSKWLKSDKSKDFEDSDEFSSNFKYYMIQIDKFLSNIELTYDLTQFYRPHVHFYKNSDLIFTVELDMDGIYYSETLYNFVKSLLLRNQDIANLESYKIERMIQEYITTYVYDYFKPRFEDEFEEKVQEEFDIDFVEPDKKLSDILYSDEEDNEEDNEEPVGYYPNWVGSIANPNAVKKGKDPMEFLNKFNNFDVEYINNLKLHQKQYFYGYKGGILYFYVTISKNLKYEWKTVSMRVSKEMWFPLKDEYGLENIEIKELIKEWFGKTYGVHAEIYGILLDNNPKPKNMDYWVNYWTNY